MKFEAGIILVNGERIPKDKDAYVSIDGFSFLWVRPPPWNIHFGDGSEEQAQNEALKAAQQVAEILNAHWPSEEPK